jgi:hypothetical protein
VYSPSKPLAWPSCAGGRRFLGAIPSAQKPYFLLFGQEIVVEAATAPYPDDDRGFVNDS